MTGYTWIYFLDDSWEEWLAAMPTGGVISMPNIECYDNGTRNFIILDKLSDATSEYNCTVNEIESIDHLQRLLNARDA